MRVTRRKALLLANAMLGIQDLAQVAAELVTGERLDLIDARSFRHSRYPDIQPNAPPPPAPRALFQGRTSDGLVWTLPYHHNPSFKVGP